MRILRVEIIAVAKDTYSKEKEKWNINYVEQEVIKLVDGTETKNSIIKKMRVSFPLEKGTVDLEMRSYNFKDKTDGRQVTGEYAVRVVTPEKKK